jgi:hypothetical protein
MNISTEELRMLQRCRPSLLLIGSDAAVDGFLQRLLPEAQAPIEFESARRFGSSPDVDGPVILRDATALTSNDQHQMLQWLQHTPAQVISTSPTPLFPLVEQGAFLERLYYRLNVVTITLGAELI